MYCHRYCRIIITVITISHLRHDALEVLLEAEDELLEGEVDRLGQDVLRLQRERSHVPVRLEEVQQLRRVGHPERQPGSVGLVHLEFNML